MANVTISDLPNATIPIDPANTFFEVQTIENGIDVSRRLSADQVLSALPPGLIYDVAVIETAPNLYNTASNLTTAMRVPIGTTAEEPAIEDGLIRFDSDTGLHTMTTSNNTNTFWAENIVALPGSTAPTIQGGSLLSLFQGGGTTLWFAEEGIQGVFGTGTMVLSALGNIATIDVTWNRLTTEAGAGRISWQGGGTFFDWSDTANAGVDLFIRGRNAADTLDHTAIRIDPDADVKQFYNNVEVARTLPAASGGMEVNNTLTGAGFERVLTTSDAVGGGLPSGNQFETIHIATAPSTYVASNALLVDTTANLVRIRDTSTTGAGAQPALTFESDNGTQFGFFSFGDGGLGDVTWGSSIQGQQISIVGQEGAGGGQRRMAEFDPDAGFVFYHEDSPSLSNFTNGIAVRSTASVNTGIFLQNTGGTTNAALVVDDTGNQDFIIDNRQDLGDIIFQGRDSGSGTVNFLTMVSEGAWTLYFDNDINLQGQSGGASLRSTTGNIVVLDFEDNGATTIGQISNNNGLFTLDGLVASSGFGLLARARDAGGTARVMIRANPNNDVELYESGVEVARTLPAASGGFEVNNTATGGGFERVLTTSDAVGGGLPSGVLGDTVYISTAPSTYSATSSLSLNPGTLITMTDDLEIQKTTPVLTLDNNPGSTNAGSATLSYVDVFFQQPRLEIRLDTGGGNDLLLDATAQGSGQTQIYRPGVTGAIISLNGLSPSVDIDADDMRIQPSTAADTYLTVNSGNAANTSRVEVASGAQAAWMEYDNTSGEFFIAQGNDAGGSANRTAIRIDFAVVNTPVNLYAGNTIVAQTVVASSGGLLVNNQVTGAGLERVLTTSDSTGSTTFAGLDDTDTTGLVANQFTYWNGADWVPSLGLRRSSSGIVVRDESGGTPVITMAQDSGASRATFTANGSQFAIASIATGQDLRMLLPGSELALVATPNSDIALYHNNVETARTATTANGGFEVNNLSTGSGFERVLTTSDLSGGGGEAFSFFALLNDTVTLTSTTTIQYPPEFVWTVDPVPSGGVNTIIHFEAVLHIACSTSGTTPGFRLRVDHTGNVAGIVTRFGTGYILDGTGVGAPATSGFTTFNCTPDVTETAIPLSGASSNALDIIRLEGTLILTNNLPAGDLRLGFAQNTSSATSVVVQEGSYFRIRALAET